jgi:hypothetical protein
MRLSEWRKKAPFKDAGGPKVAAVIDAVIDVLGAERDPHCWVAWGEEPAIRYTILIPTEPGLISSFVRLTLPGEGPRATTKLIRWNRVSIGELAMETQAGHRLLSFQIEQQVLRGADAEADRVAAFAMRVIRAIDGRSITPYIERSGRSARAAKPRSARPIAAKPPAAKPPATKPTTPAAATRATAAKARRPSAPSSSARPAKGPGR